MRPATIFLLAALLAPTTALRAQAAPTLAPGARVRVTSPAAGLAKREARLDAVRGDTLVLRTSGDEADIDVSVPLALVERLEVSRSRRRHTWQGLGIGLLAGAATGAVIGYSQGDTGDFLFPSAGEKAGVLAALLGTAGGLVGLAVGASMVSERWERVPLEGVRVGAAPRGAGLALHVAAAF